MGHFSLAASPDRSVHTLNSEVGGCGAHAPAIVPQSWGDECKTQARANVFQVGGAWLTGSTGKHPPGLSVNGALVTDCTQGTPPQSFPAGIAFDAVQVPSQLTGGSKEVCATPEPSPAQLAAAAVSVAGSSHDPLGASHVQAPHGGPSGSP
jgi:hypothetical protein